MKWSGCIFFWWSSEVMVTTIWIRYALVMLIMIFFLQVPVWWHWSCQHKHILKTHSGTGTIHHSEKVSSRVYTQTLSHLFGLNFTCSRHPEKLGKWSNLTCAYFSNGLVQPPTRKRLHCYISIGTMSCSGARSLHTKHWFLASLDLLVNQDQYLHDSKTYLANG